MSKIEDLNLQQDVIELYSTGHSCRSISRILKKRGFSIHHSTIARWIRTNQHLLVELAQQEEQRKQQVLNTFLDASSQILFMNRETMNLYEQAVKQEDFNSAFKALDQMGKNLLLFEKLVGKPAEEQELVHLIERLPVEYREAIEVVRTRRNRSSN